MAPIHDRRGVGKIMDIPRKLKILGHTYDINFDANMFRNEDTGGGKACANGLYITLADDSPESRQAEIFLHEIIEQLNFFLQLNLKHDVLSALSEGLFSVIRNNKLNF